jgi:hypothetical protein
MRKTKFKHLGASSRVQRVLDLCQSDFPKMNDEERTRWGIEIGKFIGIISSDPKKSGRLDPKAVARLWSKLQEFLETLRGGGAWCETVGAKLTIHQEKGIVKTSAELCSDSLRMEPHVAILFTDQAGSLAVCANDRCNRRHPRFFIKSKRQAYCTTRCRDTVNKRKHREKRKC